MPKVFISYNRKDELFAKKLEKLLASEGADVWLDEKRLQVGDSIIEKISSAINTSDYVIAVLSKSSVNSKWVQKELLWAVTKEQELEATLVLPVVIEDCKIPSFLKDKHYIHFGEPNDFIESFNKLLEKLFTADTQELCEYCKNNVPLSLDRCPHCARSAPPPNVRAARVPIERETLDIRYEDAISDAKSRGCWEMVRQFETALIESKVVIVSSVKDLIRLVGSSNELYSTYYRLVDSGLRVEAGSKWDVIRAVADALLFPGYKEHIRFSTLSLSGKGLSNYGDCSLVLRDDLISHRTSFFEESSNLFMQHHNIKMTDVNHLPLGYRADWKDRGKLCVAKLARKITSDTTPDDFPHLLLQNGTTFNEDDFIEGHIWGSLTIRAVEKVFISSRAIKRKSEKVILKALNEKLNRIGIKVEISEQ